MWLAEVSGTQVTTLAPVKSREVTFAAERIGENVEEFNALALAHWEEFFGDVPFGAKLDELRAMQSSGALVYFAARYRGRLVGHIGFLLIYTPVQRETLAMDAFYFTLRDHRRHGTARDLLRFAGEELTKAGLRNVVVSNLASMNLGQLIESAGYGRAATLYRFKGE